MISEKIIGNIKDTHYENKKIDYVDFEWHETYKKLHKKKTHSGESIGIRFDNDILAKGIKDGDILYEDKEKIVVANILPFNVIIIDIDKNHNSMIAKVCYEIGNKHAALFRGENENQFLTPYNEPTKVLLEKLHGVSVSVKKMKVDLSKNISSTIHNHTH